MHETIQKTSLKPALDLRSGDILVGEQGGLSGIHDVRNGTLIPGFVTVETEHGMLLLDDDRDQLFEVITR